jgi:hypothetical protein
MMQAELDQREAVVRQLQESLAIARTESELFQQRWMEAQIRAQRLGVDFGDSDAAKSDRQVIDSLRALYLAEAERQQLVERTKRLLAAVEANREVAAEVERTKDLLAALQQMQEARSVPPPGSATLESAKVLEVEPKLRLIVLDVGGQQGVRVGMPFEILREGRVIAQLRVVEVRRRISGALMEKTERGVTVTAGDAARVTKG